MNSTKENKESWFFFFYLIHNLPTEFGQFENKFEIIHFQFCVFYLNFYLKSEHINFIRFELKPRECIQTVYRAKYFSLVVFHSINIYINYSPVIKK